MNTIKKNLFTILLIIITSFSIISCSEKNNSTENEPTVNTDNVSSNSDIFDTELPNTSDASNESMDIISNNAETAETTNENASNLSTDPKENIEMVDWETWARQADHNDACLVVWNENTGTQKILSAIPDSDDGVLHNSELYIYTVQEGDRFAVPRRANVSYVHISNHNIDTELYWQSEDQAYMELTLPVGEYVSVHIILLNTVKSLSYWFNIPLE